MLWNSPGIHLESIWSPVELWNPVEWWWNQHYHSMWNPDGYSRWNLAIPCGFHVEYRWNGITKKSGIPAKIYSIWNEWNLSGIR